MTTDPKQRALREDAIALVAKFMGVSADRVREECRRPGLTATKRVEATEALLRKHAAPDPDLAAVAEAWRTVKRWQNAGIVGSAGPVPSGDEYEAAVALLDGLPAAVDEPAPVDVGGLREVARILVERTETCERDDLTGVPLPDGEAVLVPAAEYAALKAALSALPSSTVARAREVP